MKQIFLTVCLSLGSISCGAEEVYRWTDPEGHTTFTNSPTPPSLTHQLLETQRYDSLPLEQRLAAQQNLEAMREYNLTHPLPTTEVAYRNRRQGPTFSKWECNDAMRHYKLEAESLKGDSTATAAAEAEMQVKCGLRPRTKEVGVYQDRRSFYATTPRFRKPYCQRRSGAGYQQNRFLGNHNTTPRSNRPYCRRSSSQPRDYGDFRGSGDSRPYGRRQHRRERRFDQR
ncbi:hypothetical protein CCP3SC1AL1_880003 [Gammaproteobacteria bacterium]